MHFFFKFQHLKVHTAATILRSTSRPETGDTYFVPYHSSDSSLFREREFQEKTAGFKTCPPLLGVTVRISTLGRLPPALSFCKMDTQTPPGAAMEGKERSGRQRRWHHVWNRIPVTDVWGTHSDVWTPQLEWTLRLIPSSRSPPPPAGLLPALTDGAPHNAKARPPSSESLLCPAGLSLKPRRHIGQAQTPPGVREDTRLGQRSTNGDWSL